ncbi:MAG TPA: hypothetical protein VMC02_05510 [Steroidobacteraceae bacterium]|nr:hypothetical protein [Steroidobacteraceae bacterium]
MDREPEDAAQLEQRVTRVLAGSAQFKAPQDLQTRVLQDIERRARVPWWRRRVLEWPPLAQALFALTGALTAAVLVLGRLTTSFAFGEVIERPAAVLQQPAAQLHVTLDVISVFDRLADTVAGNLSDEVWYAGLALCIAAYVALLVLVACGYRLLQWKQIP